jgi:energy-coupling factor transport system substrate-specific component
MRRLSEPRFLGLMAVCVGLNLGIGFIVTTTKLPLYLDSIGLISVIVGSAYTPTLWAYAGTMTVIAIYVAVVRPFGYLSKWTPTALFGIGLGVACAVISAPVTTYVWKGMSLSGADSVAAFFSSKGLTPLVSVILTGLAVDPIDKLVTSVIAFGLMSRIPTGLFAEPAAQDVNENKR